MRASFTAPPPGFSPPAGFQAPPPALPCGRVSRQRVCAPRPRGWCCCGSHAEQLTAGCRLHCYRRPCSPRPRPSPNRNLLPNFPGLPVSPGHSAWPSLSAAPALESVTESGGPAGASCRARPGEEPPSSCPSAAQRGTAPTQHTRKTTLLRLGTRQHAAWPLGPFGQGLPRPGPGTAWGRGQALGQPPVALVKGGRFHSLHPSPAL